MAVHPSNIILQAVVSASCTVSHVGDRSEAVKSNSLQHRASRSRGVDWTHLGRRSKTAALSLPLLRISPGKPIYGGEDELLVLVHE